MDRTAAIFRAFVAMKVRRAVLIRTLRDDPDSAIRDQVQQDINAYTEAIEVFESQFARELYEYRQRNEDPEDVGLVDK